MELVFQQPSTLINSCCRDFVTLNRAVAVKKMLAARFNSLKVCKNTKNKRAWNLAFGALTYLYSRNLNLEIVYLLI